jgi:hypothetical protein
MYITMGRHFPLSFPLPTSLQKHDRARAESLYVNVRVVFMDLEQGKDVSKITNDSPFYSKRYFYENEPSIVTTCSLRKIEKSISSWS